MVPAVRFVNPTLSTAAWVWSAGRMDIFILLGGAKVRVSLSRERAHEHGGQSRPHCRRCLRRPALHSPCPARTRLL